MRSIHAKIVTEYGQESVRILRRWEKLEMKVSDFQNHRRFTLRCLSKDLTPVSIKLKTTVKTPKGNYIVRKAEKMLLNERVRSINNTINMFKWQIDTCINSLGSYLNMEAMEECHRFINLRREKRHKNTLDRQIKKFNLLWQRKTGGRSYQHGGKGLREEDTSKSNTNIQPTDENITRSTDGTSTTSRGENHNRKWVHNLTKTPLTEDQTRVLSRGPNFAIVTKEPPVYEYVSQIERVCQDLNHGKAEELRGEIKSILNNIQSPRPNISRGESRALKELKRDQDKVILTADKGVSMVVMQKEDYTKKSEDLLKQHTYRELSADPTTKCKNKLINLLKKIKAEGGMNNITYKRLYPTGATTPKYYGLPKIHKADIPLRSSRGSVTYETAKELAKIIKPLVGRSPHHVNNNKDFLDCIKNIKLQQDECIMSYDVTALFTSIPIDSAIKTIQKHLEEDKDLSKRTNMTVGHIICLLEFCLRNTYFTFNGRFFEQTEGAAMGSPISPLVANIFMEEFEVQAIRTSPTPPTLWKRFVDDTFTIIKKTNREVFLQHLNSIHPNINFTCEAVRDDGSMPFLDILVTPEEDGSLKTSVFRKTTHTDLYLQWDSHHTIPSKYSVAGTLFHRANTVCSNPQLLQEEERHLQQALIKCKYPTWAINRAKIRSKNPSRYRARRTQTVQSNNNNQPTPYMVVPYHQGLSERIKRTCNKFGVQVFFKGGQTIKGLLMAPKDKDPITKKSGVIYRYKCSEHGCNEEYIGESARNFADRFKEHQKPPSPIFDHSNTSGHNFDINNFTIVGREEQNLTRAIKEALYIRVNDPSLNRNIGKYHLPHIWDEVLHKTSELKLKN